MLAKLRSQDFTARLKTSGTLQTQAGVTIPMVVEEVSENPRAKPKYHAPDRRTPFSVLFSVVEEQSVHIDGLCNLALNNLDTIEGVFVVRIVPQGEQDGKAWYQVVFN